MNDEPLEVVDNFKYVGATLTKDGKVKNIRMSTSTSAFLCVSTI